MPPSSRGTAALGVVGRVVLAVVVVELDLILEPWGLAGSEAMVIFVNSYDDLRRKASAINGLAKFA